jgi:hypothetical protein
MVSHDAHDARGEQDAAAALARLALLVERLLDAELLLDAEGARLLTPTQAARHFLETGETPVARRHLQQVARDTQELVRTHALAAEDAQALIQLLDAILEAARPSQD